MKHFFNLLIALCLGCTLAAQSKGTLLVANKADHSVSIINLKDHQVVATLPVGHGPHELAVSPSGKMAAVANYGDKAKISNSLTILDVAKREKIKDIDLGEFQRPHGMEFMNENEVLVTCETKKTLLKVNISTGAVTEVAKTDQLTSHMVAYSRTDQKAYVANISSGTVSVIDVAKNVLLRQIPFKPGIEGLAVSPDGRELWVANRNDSTVIAINTQTLEKLTTLPAHQIAYRVKFLPNGRHVLVSNGLSGNVSVYDVASKTHLKDIDFITETGPHPVPVGIAVSKDSKWAFVCNSGYNQVVVVNTQDWSIVKRIAVGNGPDGVDFGG